MPIKVAALVRIDAQASALSDLTMALDAQTLPAQDFEVLLVASRLGEPAGARVAELIRRRPNVRLVTGEVADALQQSSADWIISLTVRDLSLRPAALERLVVRAEDTGSDLVLGRVDLSDGRELDDVLARDSEKVTATPTTVVSAMVLQRRTLALDHGVVADETSAATLLAAASGVATLGTYQCASRTWGGRDALPSPVDVQSVTAEWRDGELVIQTRGTVEPGTQGELLVAIRAVASNVDHWLPTTGSVDADGNFVATAQLDPASAADGAPIEDGRWAFTVGVHGHEPHRSGRRRVPHVPGLRSSVVAGRPIVAEPVGPSLILDVGATKASIVGRVPATDVAIAESFRGTLLRARLPRVATWDGPAANGQLLLDKFALPARIVNVDGSAQLECHLSGLAGRSHLSSRFGRATASMELELEISETGQMTVRRQEPPPAPVKGAPAKKTAAKKAAKKAAAKKAAAKKAAPKKATPVPRRASVQRLRRALPGRLDPAIAKMTSSPKLTRLYRKAAGLPDR